MSESGRIVLNEVPGFHWGEEMARLHQITPKQRETIYKERGVVCEACGDEYKGEGRRFPIHHWTYALDWYEKGYYSILCWKCHEVLTNWGWGRSPVIKTYGYYNDEEYLEIEREKREGILVLLAKWAPIYRREQPKWKPKGEGVGLRKRSSLSSMFWRSGVVP